MILCFTGTGNSLAVARHLAARFGDNIADIAQAPAIPARERVIWVCPVYAWGLPRIVDRYIAVSSLAHTGTHYLVLTCGDDVGRTDRLWREALVKAGAQDIRGAWSVQMPNTYVALPGFDVDSPELARDKLAAMPARVDHIADAIAAGSRLTDVVPGDMPAVKTGVLRPLFNSLLMSARPFHVTAACTSCGTCVRSCPMRNIGMSPAAPVWGDNCTMCLRCYHICPRHAVAYRFTEGKGQKEVRL